MWLKSHDFSNINDPSLPDLPNSTDQRNFENGVRMANFWCVAKILNSDDRFEIKVQNSVASSILISVLILFGLGIFFFEAPIIQMEILDIKPHWLQSGIVLITAIIFKASLLFAKLQFKSMVISRFQLKPAANKT